MEALASSEKMVQSKMQETDKLVHVSSVSLVSCYSSALCPLVKQYLHAIDFIPGLSFIPFHLQTSLVYTSLVTRGMPVLS